MDKKVNYDMQAKPNKCNCPICNLIGLLEEGKSLLPVLSTLVAFPAILEISKMAKQSTLGSPIEWGGGVGEIPIP